MINKGSPPAGLDIHLHVLCIHMYKVGNDVIRRHWPGGSVTCFGTIHGHLFIKTLLHDYDFFCHFLPIFYSLKKPKQVQPVDQVDYLIFLHIPRSLEIKLISQESR